MVNDLKTWLELIIQKAKDLQTQHEYNKYQLLGERAAFEAVLKKLTELEHGAKATSNSNQPSSSQEGATAKKGSDV